MKHFTVTMRLHTTDIENGISVDIGGGSTEVTLSKISNLKSLTAFHSAWYHLSVSFW